MADTGGRVTMPFLPTLVTVALLAAASVYCTKQDAPAPAAAARMIPVSGAPSLAMTEPAAPVAAPAAGPAARPPAVIAFSEVFPLTADPATTSALSATPGRTASAVPAQRTGRHLAAAGRRNCQGRRCPESSAQDDPFAPARPPTDLSGGPERRGPSAPVQFALPFAESVAEAIVPVAREVGAGIGARVERITGGASDLVHGGQSVVKGSVSTLTDSLF